MSHIKDTDYLAISTRVHAMENRLLTQERMERMIEAKSDAEAAKVLTECGYGELSPITSPALEALLAQARTGMFRELAAAVPVPALVELFELKYDYHNAKVLLKAKAAGVDGSRLLLLGGRYDPAALAQGVERDELSFVSSDFRAALDQAAQALEEDPQAADMVLDRCCYQEMARLAKESGCPFLEGYVRLSVDAVNLRTAVRAARLGKGSEFLSQALLPGGNVSTRSIASTRIEELPGLFQSGPLSQAAQMGAPLAAPGAPALTQFERACDDALAAYLSAARRVPFGPETVVGYLSARESEATAIRTILSGRMAGLDADTIRSRLRSTYA